MFRILHAADLHLSDADRDYSLGVFAELLDLARRERVDFLLFCGDLFDTFPDAEKLRPEARRLLQAALAEKPGFEFLFLPGNHEALRRGNGELARLDFGPITSLETVPFDLIRRERDGEAVEFLAIPHQEDYSGYGSWSVPPKSAPWRLALAHGIVAGMAYRGPDAEGGAGALDPDLFARFQVDYAALGHIHGRRNQVMGPVTLAYPGSTRVWRKHESGPRGANLLDLPSIGVSGGASGGTRGGRPLEPAFRPLASAGEYRHVNLALTLDGSVPDVDRLAAAWGPRDSVEIELSGLVEDEHIVARLAEGIRARHASKVRQLDINRDRVLALSGISANPVARQFLELWENRPERASQDPAVGDAYMRARDLALAHLKACLERNP